jgi:uncharacterized protein YndB with AHSA1/START domain
VRAPRENEDGSGAGLANFLRMPCRLEWTVFVLGLGLATIWLNSGGRAGGEYQSLQSGTSVAFRRTGRRQSIGHLKGSAVMSAAATTTTTANTIRLHRVLRAAPERIYRAFLDADAMAKWLPPNGFTGKVHHMDARVGGTHRMSFTNFSTGKSHSFGGSYLELTPHERIRYTDKFDDPNLPGEMQTTITLKNVSVGTEVSIVQEGVPAIIPAEACYLGWQESLTLLAKLVEAEIPD